MSTLQKPTSITEAKILLQQSEAELMTETQRLNAEIDSVAQNIPHMSKEHIDLYKALFHKIFSLFKSHPYNESLIPEFTKRFETLLQMFDSRIDQIS